jgi:anaerobic selenocysteine-containing dehydrogenase
MNSKSIRTICQLCHNNCGVIAARKADGGISVKGDPEHPLNRGHCCPKVAVNVEMQRSPDRLTHPLLKTTGGFKRITWDEALAIAADRLSEIRHRHGPLSLVRCTGAPVSYSSRDGFLEFMGAFGSPNLTSVGNICMAPRMLAYKSVIGAIRPEPDYENTQLVLFWGSNPVGIERYAAYAAFDGMHDILPRLKARGVRTICIDPYCSETARQADQWIQVKPGGDNALGLAMIHVIIEEELYDKEFVDSHTIGFEPLADQVRAFNPDWAEAYTGVPAREIKLLARTYATTGPAAVYEGNGLDMYANGVEAVRAIAILAGLTGNVDVPGGNVLMPFPHPPALPTRPADRTARIGYDRFPAPVHVPFPMIKEALLHGRDEKPRAMIVHHGNPVLTQANPARTRQALAELDFLMVFDIFPTATTELADLVLPCTTDFEAHGYRAYSSTKGAFMALARPVADPVGEARSVFEAEYALARKMGLENGYPFHDDVSWIDFMVKPGGIDFDRLDSEQIIFVSPGIEYRKFEKQGFDTPTGKLEFHSHWFENLGLPPLPDYRHPAGVPMAAGDLEDSGFTLLGTSKRPKQFVHTRFKNLPRASKSYPEPLVYLSPEDADKRDIVDGAGVEVRSPHGRIELKAAVTRDTSAGLVWIDFGWGNPTDGKASINDLVDDEHMDELSGGTPHRLFPCEVRSLP